MSRIIGRLLFEKARVKRSLIHSVSNSPESPYAAIVTEVVMSVPFDMSIADTQFLFNYAQWRLARPAKKQPERGMLPEDLKRSG